MNVAAAANGQSSETMAITANVRAQVAEYLSLPGQSPAEVQLLSTQRRSRSQLYRFEVRGPRGDCAILVKVGGASASAHAAPAVCRVDRPRIAPPLTNSVNIDLEYRALSLIHHHFTRLGDPRFGTIRLFDRLPAHHGFAMEAVDEPDLRSLSLRGGWRSAASLRDLEETFGHAGAWLRTYHGLHGPDGVEELQTRRDDFVGFSTELADYLAAHTGYSRFLRRLLSTIAALTTTHLPDHLPLGLAHGDYAMRNILAGRNRRVTVLDTNARFRTCIYRDIGSLLQDLRCSVAPALARGAVQHAWRRDSYGRAFIAGYFDVSGRIPYVAVRLYEVQSILERWAAAVAHVTGRSGAGSNARVGLPLLSAFFCATIRSALRTVTREAPSTRILGEPSQEDGPERRRA